MAEPAQSPSLKDLLTMTYRPRETMRRILDGPRSRWAPEIVVLAFICSSIGDSDIRELQRVVPSLSLMPMLAIVVLGLLVGAAIWVLCLYLFAWIAALVGRWLEGQGTVADVRAALAWGLLPRIWSVIFRIPIAVYRQRFALHGPEKGAVLFNFIEQGGCTFAVIMLTILLVFDAWVLFVASCCVGEALRFSSWKGFGTIAISLGAPIAIIAAAVIAFRT